MATQQASNEKSSFVSYFQEENKAEPLQETLISPTEPELTPNPPSEELIVPIDTLIATTVDKNVTLPNPTTQLLLAGKLTIHMPEAGLNPLVDAAAYLFSIMGKLKHIKSNHNLGKLHDELKREIENFRAVIETYSYNAHYIAEYIPITCYALCVSLDDIISNMPWGSQGQWQEYNLVATFVPNPPSHSSFFLILERLIMDPTVYIDLMEFLYICLNLGFKCGYSPRTSEFNNEQIDQVINSLYKRIRAYRGNFNRALSPFSIKPTPTTVRKFNMKSLPKWLMIMLVSSMSILLFTGGVCLLELITK